MEKSNLKGQKDFLGNTRFTRYEIDEFVQRRFRVNSFATVTTKESATFSIEEKDFFFCFKDYQGDVYCNIINQASEWIMKVVRTEDWDPSIYGSNSKKTEEKYMEIDPRFILVKEDKFAGVITYNSCFDLYEVCYCLAEDYKDEPIFCWALSGFGSSDHDMMYTEKYYLMKKSS